MHGVIEGLESATSALHIYGLSFEVLARLIANDPFGALSITLVGCACVVLLTLTIIGMDVLKWIVQRSLRKREFAEEEERRRLKDKSD
jgi:hypothetical protein